MSSTTLIYGGKKQTATFTTTWKQQVFLQLLTQQPNQVGFYFGSVRTYTQEQKSVIRVTGQSSFKITLRPGCLQVGFPHISNLIFRNIENQCCNKRVVHLWYCGSDEGSIPSRSTQKIKPITKMGFIISINEQRGLQDPFAEIKIPPFVFSIYHLIW